MKKYAKNFKLVLLVSAAALTACATNLANRTPIDIASNSVRRTDALSGVSEVIAPRVSVFSGRRSGVRGQAQFRTAGPFTDDAGKVHTGGAYLDISMKYTSATPNPAEARMYDQANWPGGQPALIADYGASVLDCREDVRAIPQYTPIYGAWGFGHIHDDYCSHDGYGYPGWGRGYGHYGHGHVHDDDCGHDVDRDGDTVVVRPTTDPRPTVPRRPRRPGDVTPHPDGPGTDPDVRPRRPRTGPGDPLPRPRAIPYTTKRAVSRPRPDIVSPKSVPRPRPVSRPVSRPAVQSGPKIVSRPAPVSKPVSRPVSKPISKPKSTYKPKPQVSRPQRTPTPRVTPRTNVRRQMNYYPRDRYYNQGPTDYVVRRSCDRQENLRVFVPRGRLDAAEAQGLVLYVSPRGGQEEMLVLPPNYISGFKLAAWSPEGERLTMPGKVNRPVQAVQTATPYQAKPDPNKPIIYGEN